MDPRQQPVEDVLDLLVEDALLSRAMADALVVRARDSWIPLGKILRQQGAISMGQLMDLLQEQANEPGTLLGEIAVRLGYCQKAEVERALETQREMSPHVIDLLLAEGTCDTDRLCRVLARYVRRLEERLSSTSGTG